MMKLFDAHCHFPDDALFPDLGKMIERAAAAGVEGRAVCFDYSNPWKKEDDFFQGLEKMVRADAIGENEAAMLWPLTLSVGIHPWFVSNDWKENFQTLEAYCIGTHSLFPGSGKVAPMLSVGETGLDFSSSAKATADRQERFSNRVEQEASFAAHLDLARELNRPVTVHCVQAWGRLLEILRKHPAPRVLLHSFGGAPELIPELMKLNCWFSFGPSVINPAAKRARASAVAIPADRLLIETDSMDEPEKLIDIARAVAELRGVSVDEIADLTFSNAQKLFF